MQVLHGNRMAGKWLPGSLAVWAGVPTAPSVLIERSRGETFVRERQCLTSVKAESEAQGRHPTRAVCVESRELSNSTLTQTLFCFHVKMSSSSDRSGAAASASPLICLASFPASPSASGLRSSSCFLNRRTSCWGQSAKDHMSWHSQFAAVASWFERKLIGCGIWRLTGSLFCRRSVSA